MKKVQADDDITYANFSFPKNKIGRVLDSSQELIFLENSTKKGCLFSHFYKHKILKPCTISSIYRSLRFMRKESWNGARRKAIKAMDKFVF